MKSKYVFTNCRRSETDKRKEIFMDLLRSYELYELLQLYIVSEVAMTANSSQLYAALFTSLPPKPIDLGLVKQKYNKVFLMSFGCYISYSK